MDNYSEVKGLSSKEVEDRKRKGFVNNVKKKTTKSYKQILIENIFSLFNFINLIIAVILIYVGSAKNCLFMLVVVCNTIIGVIQEIRSKRIIDKLSIINQSSVNAIRDGKIQTVNISDIVIDDIIKFSAGSQIPNDCTLIEGSCEVNESLITGESDSIFKESGSQLLSGSYLVSGTCLCKVDKVGNDNYADSILGQIKYVKRAKSEIVRVIKRIILVISICIVPLSILLFFSQYNIAQNSFKEAVVNTSAAIIGMIPEGLVLLISTVFAIGVIRLSKRNVLSQDLYSLESLARTDVLCLDKTGTITTGNMNFKKLVPANGIKQCEVEKAANILAAFSSDSGSTIAAIKNAFSSSEINCNVTGMVPFSSDRKWSAICTENAGTYIMGAAEMIFGENCDYSCLNEDEMSRYRVVSISKSETSITERTLPDDVKLLGYILLSEEVRESIADTFKYFQEQQVKLKIISGDNSTTVQQLCRSVLDDVSVKCVDMSKVSDEEIVSVAEENDIFGRVTPKQKKLIVSALKKNGHTVGMVGDGVNDVLALKESDCSVGLANGSEAARNVSQLVLMDSDFRSLPNVVKEGRKSINNLQNSASLFLSKTVFSAVMAVVFLFLNLSYPFQPIQMTLISALTIGMPSFILSFENNKNRVNGSFLMNVIRKFLPASLTNIINIILIVVFSNLKGFTDVWISTLSVLALAVTGIMLIIHIYKPLTKLRIGVLIVSIFGFVSAFILFGEFFALSSDFISLAPYMLAVVALSIAIFHLISFLISYFTKKI